MSVDKLVDSTQLDADLTSVADAIRAKTGGTADLQFPADFVSEIGSISGGGEIYYTPNMVPYAKDMHIPGITMGIANFGLMSGAENLETVICDDNRTLGGSNPNRVNAYFRDCTELISAEFPYLQGFLSSYINSFFSGCTSLKKVIFGSIGYPITNLQPTATNDRIFSGLTQADLVITVYVNANTLADVPAEVTTLSPWGATNATIVYKSSVTGEVLV